MTAVDDLIADLDRNRFVSGDQIITCTVDTFVAALQYLTSGVVPPGTLIPGEVVFGSVLGTVAQDTSLTYDNAAKRFGVGLIAPDAPITINNNGVTAATTAGTQFHIVAPDASIGGISIDSYGGGNGFYETRRTGGTRAAPTAIGGGTVISRFDAKGYDGANYILSGSIRLVASEAWGVGSNGTDMVVLATTAGTAAEAVCFRLNPLLCTISGGMSAPNYTVTGNGAPLNGLYLSAANEVTIATNFVSRVSFSSVGLRINTTFTVATLPAPTAGNAGTRANVTDALAPVFAAVVMTGGAVFTPVYSDGVAWRCG